MISLLKLVFPNSIRYFLLVIVFEQYTERIENLRTKINKGRQQSTNAALSTSGNTEPPMRTTETWTVTVTTYTWNKYYDTFHVVTYKNEMRPHVVFNMIQILSSRNYYTDISTLYINKQLFLFLLIYNATFCHLKKCQEFTVSLIRRTALEQAGFTIWL
jgi:hypothetical protein